MPQKTPKFGPRKIGLAEFRRQQVTMKQKTKFGPRKFGHKKAAQRAVELAEVNAAADAAKVEQAPGPKPFKDEPEGTLSIKQIGAKLTENVSLYEEFYQMELVRAEGPRKGAMRIFLAFEMGKDEGPDEARLQAIEAVLKPTPPAE